MNKDQYYFEEWHRATQASPLNLDKNGEYGNAFTFARWEAWQASRSKALDDAALCAEDCDNVEAKSSMSYYAQLGDASATKYKIANEIHELKDKQ